MTGPRKLKLQDVSPTALQPNGAAVHNATEAAPSVHNPKSPLSNTLSLDAMPMQDQTNSQSDIRLDEAAQVAIGRQLKLVYGDIVNEPVPDRFLKLLAELERKETAP